MTSAKLSADDLGVGQCSVIIFDLSYLFGILSYLFQKIQNIGVGLGVVHGRAVYPNFTLRSFETQPLSAGRICPAVHVFCCFGEAGSCSVLKMPELFKLNKMAWHV